jgi:hypothetical protein
MPLKVSKKIPMSSFLRGKIELFKIAATTSHENNQISGFKNEDIGPVNGCFKSDSLIIFI